MDASDLLLQLLRTFFSLILIYVKYQQTYKTKVTNMQKEIFNIFAKILICKFARRGYYMLFFCLTIRKRNPVNLLKSVQQITRRLPSQPNDERVMQEWLTQRHCLCAFTISRKSTEEKLQELQARSGESIQTVSQVYQQLSAIFGRAAESASLVSRGS